MSDLNTELLLAAKRCNAQEVKNLIAQEADVNTKDKYKSTPLHYVVGNNCIEIVKTILEKKGIDVNAKNNNERTSLHYAATSNIGMVEILLNAKGIDVNVKDNNGKTPLHYAAIKSDKKIVDALLAQYGIDVNATDNNGWTPLDLAVKRGNEDIIAILKTKGAVAEEYKSENMPLYSMTDKETEFDEFTSLESDIQLSDFWQAAQDQLI